MNVDRKNSKKRAEIAYLFAFLSALIGVGVKLMDAYISRNIITVSDPEDKAVAACVYLTLGGIIGSAVLFALAQTPFGRVLDPTFRGFRPGTARFQRNSAIAGLSAAFSTSIYLFALQKGYDPATLITLASSRILWIMAYEYFRNCRQTGLYIVLGPALLMVTGVWVGEGTNRLSVEAIVLIFGLSSMLDAVCNVHNKIATEEADATSSTVWGFSYLGLFGTALSLLFVAYLGKIPLYVRLLGDGLLYASIPIAGLMVLVFFTNGWSARAKAHLDMGASKVEIIANLRIVGVLVSLLIIQYIVGSDKFGQLPTDIVPLTRKIIGALIVTASCVWLTARKG